MNGQHSAHLVFLSSLTEPISRFFLVLVLGFSFSFSIISSVLLFSDFLLKEYYFHGLISQNGSAFL